MTPGMHMKVHNGRRAQKMCLLLRECFLTQRWPEATSVMTGLAKEVKDTGQIIVKVTYQFTRCILLLFPKCVIILFFINC